MAKRVKIGLIFWHFSKQNKKKTCVYFNCLVTCKTCSAHWVMRIRWFIYIFLPQVKSEAKRSEARESKFLMSFRKLSFGLQNGTGTMRDSYDECWTDSEFMTAVFSYCAKKKRFTWWFSIHTLAHADGKCRTCQPPPHQPVEWTIHSLLLQSLLSKVNKRSLRDNIVRAISIFEHEHGDREKQSSWNA